ncbi:MAG TPA: EVE domain-containing protein [Candidatus Kapabacteria bacterium]|nr:EVE domain-containing protein [Candidatus Kapabacteria bacterium]
MEKKYWLLKTEPTSYGIDDLARDKTTDWGGVRNYTARNTIRDLMTKGDLAFFYHSSTDVPAIVGVAEIASDAHPDPSAMDFKDDHFDPKSSPSNPIWFSRTIKFKQKFKSPISLTELRNVKGLEKMFLLQKGSRLSVQPVTEKEWDVVMKKAK